MNKRIKLSIITPTIGRSTLEDTILSIDKQSYRSWEHIIIYDGDQDEIYLDLVRKYTSRRRKVYYTGKKYNDFGHTPRRIASERATGDYIMYMDDDDTYLPNAFKKVAHFIDKFKKPTFLVFPCLRLGEVFFNLPAGAGRTTSVQYAHRRFDKQGRKIKFTSGGYNHDSDWIQEMVNVYDFSYLNCEPLVQVDRVSRGEFI